MGCGEAKAGKTVLAFELSKALPSILREWGEKAAERCSESRGYYEAKEDIFRKESRSKVNDSFAKDLTLSRLSSSLE